MGRSSEKHLKGGDVVPLDSTVCPVSNSSRYLSTISIVTTVLNRRLEDRIRELCAKAVVTRDEEELSLILAQLRAALRENGKRLKRTAVFKLVRQDDGYQERRSA